MNQDPFLVNASNRPRSDIGRYPFDLIVIGAGINGAGIARDAALRGLRTLLVDKGDIASGTTSWSTRLIHGGLRYLEHREVSLVRESLRERETLLRIVPHLVRPLRLLIPIYTRNARGPLLIRMGMLAYDALSFDKSLEHHQMLDRDEVLRREPGLNPDGLLGAALYYDAQVEYPERLTLENVLSARENGAEIATYCRVDGALREGNRVCGVRFTDLIDGTTSVAHGRIVVNAAGPWVDDVLTAEGVLPATPLIGGTKGSHIVVQPFPGAPRTALYVEARENRRPYFIIPWNDLYLIGTTDVRYTGDLDRVVADESEIDYLIRETNAAVPDANLDRSSVLYAYAGVRPLPYAPSGTEGAITRRHIIHDHAPAVHGLVSIVGGKLTTYRNLAEQAVDLVCRKLGAGKRPCTSAKLPLPGARTSDLGAFSHDFMRQSGVDPEVARRLLRVYGTRAQDVLLCTAGNSELLKPLDGSEAIGGEVVFAFREEFARSLTDVLMRRTMVGLSSSVGIGPDVAAACIGRQHLGWTEERAEREVSRFREYADRFIVTG